VTDEPWQRFAREDAEYYVLTDVGGAGVEARRTFFASGHSEAQRILRECEPYVDGRELPIEIGCGVGRVALSANVCRELGPGSDYHAFILRAS
jgi:hypothetical protein